MSSQIGPPISTEQMAALPPEFRALLQSVIDYYEHRIAGLEAELQALKRTPQNSSLPPSTQHPHAKAAPPKPKSRRKRGGQPGHARCERPLIPVERCDRVVRLHPGACRRCGRALSEGELAPLRHQVWELPEIRPVVTEYQRHRRECRCCRETTCAELPVGVPSGQSGPRLTAFVGLLMACFRQSKRRTALFLEAILGQPCSTGLTVKLQNLVTDALRPAYDELCGQLPSQPVLNIDETPTKEGTRKSWLWTFVAPRFTVYRVRSAREATVLDELLTDRFAGVVGCDRAKMYWRLKRLQWCWAHLVRDFQSLIDAGPPAAKQLGRDLLKQTKRLFQQWHRYRDRLLTRTGLKRVLAPVRAEIERLLRRGLRGRHAKTAGTCQELLQHRHWLWTFLDHEGIDPTNNASERALRPAVIWRKLSFGTQSAKGSRFVETLLTVIETCRQQSRNVFQFVTAATTRLDDATRPAPSLLPTA
jgi:transposase